MISKAKPSAPREGSGPLSRAEIETLCMLASISSHGCPAAALPERLGLSPSLCDAVERAVDELAAQGLVTVTDDRLALTELGGRWLSGLSAVTRTDA
jgi:hypothetical protein